MQIVREIKHLKIHKSFVCRTVKRYNETGSVKDRPRSGRTKSATTKSAVKKVRGRIRRNSSRSAHELANQMEIASEFMSSILQDVLGLKPYKYQKGHEVTAKQEKVRLDRAELLLCWHANGQFSNFFISSMQNR